MNTCGCGRSLYTGSCCNKTWYFQLDEMCSIHPKRVPDPKQTQTCSICHKPLKLHQLDLTKI